MLEITTNSFAVTNTSLFIHLDGTQSVGPTLPIEVEEHCSVTLHDGRIMMLGKNSLE